MKGDSKEKKLLLNTVLFLAGNAGARLLMLIIVPLYTYYVEVEQMGQYDVLQTYVNLFSPIACLALYEGIYRWLLDESAVKEQVLRNGLGLALKALFCFDLAAFAVLYSLHYAYWLEFIVLLDTSCLYVTIQFTTRGLRNNKLYAVQGMIYSLTLLLATIVLVVWLGLQARGLLWALILTDVVTTTFLLFRQGLGVETLRQGRSDKSLTWTLFKYSVLLVPNTVAWWLVTASNRLLINWQLGDTANGIYAIAVKFPSLVSMLSWFFYLAWQEQAITEYGSADRDAYYTKVFNYYVRILLSGLVVLLPVTKFIITNFIAASYGEAKDYVGILYLSAAFNAFASFFGTGYLSSKKTGGAFATTILGAAANLLLCFALIERIGLLAAAIGTMVGNGLLWAARIVQTKQYFNINVNASQFFSLLAYNLLAIVAVNFANLTGLAALEVVFLGSFCFINRAMLMRGLALCLKARKGM